MICPECKKNAPVNDSRPDGAYRRRRYHCSCGVRFTTLEVVLGTGKDMSGLGAKSTRVTKGERWKRQLETQAKEAAKDEMRTEMRRYLFGGEH